MVVVGDVRQVNPGLLEYQLVQQQVAESIMSFGLQICRASSNLLSFL